MREIIDWKKLKTIVPYCRQHMPRLERKGLFPTRVRLSPGRVGWYADEVATWVESRTRVEHPDSSE